MTPLANVLIPAWNEAAVISGILSRLAEASAQNRLRITVIANNCSDATSEVARETDPNAVVLQTPQGGKANAMNLGYQAALPGIPVVCVDADLLVSEANILALIAPLVDGSAEASCGQMAPDLSASSWIVKSFYKAWSLNPYFSRGKFGGLFAVSALGASRIFPLPPVTADDEWVRRSFTAQETAFIPEAHFVAKAPRDVFTLIRLRRRSLRGARAVREAVGQQAAENSASSMLKIAMRDPSLWVPMAIYIAIMLTVRVHLKFEPAKARTNWERDNANRTTGAHP